MIESIDDRKNLENFRIDYPQIVQAYLTNSAKHVFSYAILYCNQNNPKCRTALHA